MRNVLANSGVKRKGKGSICLRLIFKIYGTGRILIDKLVYSYVSKMGGIITIYICKKDGRKLNFLQ